MPTAYETHPDDVTLSCPAWAEWLDDRHVSVRCRACRCVYTGRRWEPVFSAGSAALLGRPGAERDGGYWGGGVPAACGSCRRAAREAARKTIPLDPVLVEAVKAHALSHYDRGGWDYVVETYTDREIWEVIAGSRTPRSAVRRMAAVVGLLAERRAEASAY